MQELRDPHKLYENIKKSLVDEKQYYILLDEIQYVDRFHEVMNSLLRIENVDIYVTGSSSKFLSSDILTEFRGRGDEIRVYPLSFSEYLSAYDGTEEDAWLEYMTYGGLPRILSMQTDEQKSKYLTDLGLRNARLGFRQIEETHLMENIIYNELKRRGFNVDVGLIEIREDIDGKRVRKQLEVDFIAYKGNNKYYIQSAFSIPDEEKKRQEERPLLNIPDSFKKIVVVGNYIKLKRDDMGITTMSIREFLKKENSLNL